MKTLGVLLLLGLMLTMPLFTQAQAEDELCTEEGRTTVIDVLTQTIGRLTDNQNIEDALLAAQLAISTYRVRCLGGMVFTSEEYGQSAVTDPIVFPDGIYRVIIEAEGNASVDITELDGRCGDTFTFASADNPRNESVSQMEGCIAILDFDATVPFTLTYEPIALTDD